jgi:hypothetical protein
VRGASSNTGTYGKSGLSEQDSLVWLPIGVFTIFLAGGWSQPASTSRLGFHHGGLADGVDLNKTTAASRAEPMYARLRESPWNMRFFPPASDSSVLATPLIRSSPLPAVPASPKTPKFAFMQILETQDLGLNARLTTGADNSAASFYSRIWPSFSKFAMPSEGMIRDQTTAPPPRAEGLPPLPRANSEAAPEEPKRLANSHGERRHE